jgi:diguanylate cyclase (GGDEF)-like protein
MPLDALILPFIASSICLVFSLLFFIIYFAIERDRSFLGFSFFSLILAVNQYGVGMQYHFLTVNPVTSIFWYQIQFAALAIISFNAVYFVCVLLDRRVNTPFIFSLYTVSIVLAGLVFSHWFGDMMVTADHEFLFSPGPVAYAILVLLYLMSLYALILLIMPVFSIGWGRRVGIALSYAFGGIVLLGFGTVEILMDIGLIIPIPLRLSSVGSIVWALVGASVVLLHFYETKVSLKNILINLSETERVLEEKERLAITDSLTGLYNRGFFDESLEEEVKDSIQGNKSLSLLMMDIDGFKRVNDSLGHLIGDGVLAEISAVIKRGARASDLPARFGGEEFAVILPNTNLAEATEVADRIRKTIEEINFVVEGRPNTSVTISVGVASLKGTDLAKDLLGRADGALISAKKKGKNRVFVNK